MHEDLQKVLFIKAMTALEAYQAAAGAGIASDEARRRHDRFCAVWEIIEAAGLADEYQVWQEG